MYMYSHTYTQMDKNLDDSVMSLTDNHPYIHHHSDRRILSAAISSRCVAIEESTVFVGTIAAYYAFNMAYPKPILAVLLFIQHYLLVVKDIQPAPIELTKFLLS